MEIAEYNIFIPVPFSKKERFSAFPEAIDFDCNTLVQQLSGP